MWNKGAERIKGYQEAYKVPIEQTLFKIGPRVGG